MTKNSNIAHVLNSAAIIHHRQLWRLSTRAVLPFRLLHPLACKAIMWTMPLMSHTLQISQKASPSRLINISGSSLEKQVMSEPSSNICLSKYTTLTVASYNGKSTGAGALAIWTHHLKSITFSDYRGPTYTGKGVRMEAGVQGFEAYAAASKFGLSVNGGECPTVGLAGGYTQWVLPISLPPGRHTSRTWFHFLRVCSWNIYHDLISSSKVHC